MRQSTASIGGLAFYRHRLLRDQPWRWQGKVIEAGGLTIRSIGPNASIGECCDIIDCEGKLHPAEVIGFLGAKVLTMPVDSAEGIRFGDAVVAAGKKPTLDVSESLIGRVLNAMGETDRRRFGVRELSSAGSTRPQEQGALACSTGENSSFRRAKTIENLGS